MAAGCVSACLSFQLLLQTLLYFLGSLAALATVIPLALTSLNFGGYCLLYSEVKFTSARKYTLLFGERSACDYSIYLLVFGAVLYGLLVGAYHVYGLCKSRNDPSLRSQMWVIPFLMANGLLLCMLFISSCMISVGFYRFCSSVVNGAKDAGNIRFKTCEDVEGVTWTERNTGKEYGNGASVTYLNVAQLTSWICFLVWGCQVALCVVRVCRDRRSQARNDDTTDTRNIGNVDPTA